MRKTLSSKRFFRQRMGNKRLRMVNFEDRNLNSTQLFFHESHLFKIPTQL